MKAMAQFMVKSPKWFMAQRPSQHGVSIGQVSAAVRTASSRCFLGLRDSSPEPPSRCPAPRSVCSAGAATKAPCSQLSCWPTYLGRNKASYYCLLTQVGTISLGLTAEGRRCSCASTHCCPWYCQRTSRSRTGMYCCGTWLRRCSMRRCWIGDCRNNCGHTCWPCS